MGIILDLPFGMLIVLAIGVAQAVVFTLGLIYGNLAFWGIFIFAALWFSGIYILAINEVESIWIVAYAIAVSVGSLWLTRRKDDVPFKALSVGDGSPAILARVLAFAAFALLKFTQWSVAVVFLATPVLILLMVLGLIRI